MVRSDHTTAIACLMCVLDIFAIDSEIEIFCLAGLFLSNQIYQGKNSFLFTFDEYQVIRHFS